MSVLAIQQGEPEEAVLFNLRSLALRLELQVPEARIDLHWLGRARELLGDKRFGSVLAQHLDQGSRASVLEMLDSLSSPSQATSG